MNLDTELIVRGRPLGLAQLLAQDAAHKNHATDWKAINTDDVNTDHCNTDESNTDDVNTDALWPGKYTYVQIPRADMPAHAFEGLVPHFAERVAGHNILVLGRNFGCGSSREQASECLIACGLQVVIATSFARIFLRNSINLGLCVVEAPEFVQAWNRGAIDRNSPLEVRMDSGTLLAGEHTFTFPAFPPFVCDLLRDGGLIPSIRRRFV